MLACDAGYDVSTGASELSTKKRQVGLEDAFAAEKRLKLDRDLSKGIFYQGNIALTALQTLTSVLLSQTWQGMLVCLGTYH